MRLGEPLANGEHPSRVEAQILLAQSLAALGRPSEAEPVYRQALLVAPGRTEVVTGLAQALAASGRYDEANRTLRDLPDNRAAGVRADIERRRALDLQRRGDTFGAGAALASALRANPSDPWTRLEYARFLLERGQTAQAAQVATPLYNASDSDSLQAAALLSEARGNPDEAATLLQRIPDANRTPEVRELAGRVEARRIIQQARLAGQQGQAPQGVAYLRDFLSRNDPPFAVRSQIAETLLDLGDVYQAGALALEAAGQPPVRFRPTEASGFLAVLAQTGQDGPALGLLQAAAQQTASPADQADYRTLAALYTARRADRLRLSGDYAAAFDALSQGFALAPRDVGLLGALARLYQSGGLPEQAAQAYDALLVLSPNDPDVIRGAAQAAQAAGDHGRAERLLRRAATLRPNDAELYYQIGLLEQARGRDRSALRAFERAETLLRGGRAPGLGGGALTAPGAGVLGPNPFAPRAPVAASFPVANLAAPDVSGPALAWSATGQGTPAVQGAPYQAPPSYGAPQAYGSGAPYPQAPYVLAPQAQYAQPQYPQPQYLPGPQPQYLPGLQSQGAPAYGSSTIPANSAPYGASPPSFALPQAQPSYAGAAPSSYGAAPIPGLAASAPPAAAASLPLPTRIAREIAALRTETAPQVEGSTTFRARTGEQGTSELFEAGMRAAASVSPFGIGRLGVAVSPIIVGAGAPDEATAARIGTTPLVVAETISQGRIPTLPLEESRHEAGAAFSLFYESDPLSIDLGTTPIGFGDTRLSAGVTGRLNIGEAQIRATAEQRPVTDSLLSYAGETDRQTGVSWGGVMRQSGSLGGSLSFSSGGAYFDAIYKRLRGEAVADNTGYELNGGVYYRPIDEDGDRLQIGVNVNMQAYDKNLRFFSFGHGGYFSPQQFVAMSLPISYAQERETWRWSAGLTVGLQSYSEDSAPIFPTSSAAQAALASYGSIDASIASRYAGNDKTGVGIAGLLNGEYNLLPTTRAGGELSADTFGRYKEFRVRLYLKQIFAN
ncbi:cellulose synthase subunit BcsC-related outer membrane protein [Phenylobacterium sp. J426]|uniref:cellulose synthase subunit BcsC-related outer membrane protein n=1 Tax=Phenylobacterium sp. J426 TaxID=2898439 RepID=UPI0021518B27|nr:cellulose synthase subunit BcsC-related outer membrane protein [Phenylobacterium sp. J426]